MTAMDTGENVTLLAQKIFVTSTNAFRSDLVHTKAEFTQCCTFSAHINVFLS